MKCEICNKKVKIYIELSSHIKKHKIKSKEYYDKYLKKDNNEGICHMYGQISSCKKETRFITMEQGYKKFCSEKCSSNSEFEKNKRKQTNLKKYGVEYPNQNKNIIEKTKQTNLKKYGVEYIGQNREIKNKIKETNIERYGVEYSLQNNKIKEKIKQTNIKKYGVENPFQNEEIKNKIKKVNLEKYGCENPSQNSEIQEKKKQTSIKNWNTEHPNQSEKIKNKIKKTNLEKYGTDNPFQNKEIQDKIKQTNLKKYGVEYIGKNELIKEKIKRTYINNFIPKINKLLNNLNLELLSKYNNCRETIDIRCKTCNNIFDTTYFNLYQGHGKCPNCFPKYKSNGEIELSEFIKSLNLEIIENSRDIIKPYELDIYIPEKNIAIEFDGLYWHSEKNINDYFYHLNKTELCEKQHIQLIHIFEDEWIFKQEIVKSRLKQILNLNCDLPKIHARKCEIKEIDSKSKNEFLGKYHLQGKDNSNIKLGAFYDNELVSVMTFYNGNISEKLQYNIYELSRFCSNYSYHIPGIISKLLSYFKNNYIWREIYSYADRKWSKGNLYYKLGFEFDSFTDPNHFYIKGLIRKKSNEPKNISESILIFQNEEEKYCKIYDCGYYKFILRNQKCLKI